MQRGSLRGHHEEKQVMSSVGSEADVVGEDWKPGVSWKRREVTWFACCVGRQGGVGRTLRSPLCFLLLERKASQGKTWLRPGRVCGVPVLGSVVGEDPSRGMEAEFQPSPSPCLLAACAGAPGPLPPLGLATLVWCLLWRQPRAPCHLVLVPLPSQPLVWCPPVYWMVTVLSSGSWFSPP